MNTTHKQGWFPAIFDELFTENRLDAPVKKPFTRPKVNIVSTTDNFIISMAAPGLQKENFAIEIEKDTLIISSKFEIEATASSESNNSQYTRKEFDYSSFKRSFNLPETIDKEAINASYKAGILEVLLPVMEAKKDIKKTIEIS